MKRNTENETDLFFGFLRVDGRWGVGKWVERG